MRSMVIGQSRRFGGVWSTMSATVQAWLVCLAAALFFCYDFIQMNMFNALSEDLMVAFQLSHAELGYLSSSFLLADVLFLFPAGILLDRGSIRSILLVNLALSIIGTLGLALAEQLLWAYLFHFIAGIAHAFCFLCCVLLAARWFEPRRQAFVIGVMVTIAMLGGLLAQAPLAVLANHIGWRHALLVDVGVGFVVFYIAWLVVADYPSAKPQSMTRPVAPSFFKQLQSVVSNGQTWLYGLYTGLLNLPIMLLGALWGMKYLMQVHQVSKAAAMHIAGMIYLGTIVGAPLAGWLSDTWGKRRAPMLWGAVLSLLVFVLILYTSQLSVPMLLILFFLLGVVTSSQVISYPAIGESSSQTVIGTAMGLAAVIIMGLGGIAQPISGKLLDMWGVTDGSVIMYSNDAYRWALSIITAGFVIGWLAAYRLKETNCQVLGEKQ